MVWHRFIERTSALLFGRRAERIEARSLPLKYVEHCGREGSVLRAAVETNTEMGRKSVA